MSNCSNHSKTLFGQSDMKVVAEAIGDLHYETLRELFFQIAIKIKSDADKDGKGGRERMFRKLSAASIMINDAGRWIEEAWQISKPFMDKGKDDDSPDEHRMGGTPQSVITP